MWFEQRKAKSIQRIKHCQHDARQQRGLKQGANRNHGGLAQIGQGIRTASKLGAFFLGRGIQIPRQGAQQHDHD